MIGTSFGAEIGNSGESMTKDWQAVADAIAARLVELDMTQSELAQRADVALETVRELHHNLRTRRRSPRTLSVLSQTLGWSDDHLLNLAAGEPPGNRSAGEGHILAELASIRETLAGIGARLDSIEHRLP